MAVKIDSIKLIKQLPKTDFNTDDIMEQLLYLESVKPISIKINGGEITKNDVLRISFKIISDIEAVRCEVNSLGQKLYKWECGEMQETRKGFVSIKGLNFNKDFNVKISHNRVILDWSNPEIYDIINHILKKDNILSKNDNPALEIPINELNRLITDKTIQVRVNTLWNGEIILKPVGGGFND